MTTLLTITDLDKAIGWSKFTGPDINIYSPEGYEFVQTPEGIRLFCAGPAYGGWLARFVSPLLSKFARISFEYALTVDDCTEQQAQIIETDSKITDSNGWTYDFSAQWNINEGWMFQISNQDWTWVDTGIKVIPPTPRAPMLVKINYLLDYDAHKSSILSVGINGKDVVIPTSFNGIPAKQLGWEPSTIVTQLQQCNNGLRGAHSQLFSGIQYDMS